jgi:hypothetical protein
MVEKLAKREKTRKELKKEKSSAIEKIIMHYGIIL